MHIQAHDREGSQPTSSEHLGTRLCYLFCQLRYCSFTLLFFFSVLGNNKYCHLLPKVKFLYYNAIFLLPCCIDIKGESYFNYFNVLSTVGNETEIPDG